MTKKHGDDAGPIEQVDDAKAPSPADVKLCPRCKRLGRRVAAASSGPAAKAGLCEAHYRQLKRA